MSSVSVQDSIIIRSMFFSTLPLQYFSDVILSVPFTRIWKQKLNVNVILRLNLFLKRLNRVSPKIDPEHCEAALLPENRKKNRNLEIYPSEFSYS